MADQAQHAECVRVCPCCLRRITGIAIDPALRTDRTIDWDEVVKVRTAAIVARCVLTDGGGADG